MTGEAPAARPMPQRPVVRPQQAPPAPTRPGRAAALARPPPRVRCRRRGRPLAARVRCPLSPFGRRSGAPRPPIPRGPAPDQFRPAGPRPGGRGAATIGRRMPPQEALPPITKLITLAEGMTVKDLADKLEVKVKDSDEEDH